MFQPHGTARLDPTQLMLGTFYFSQEQTVFKDGGLEVLEITGKNNGKYIFLRQSRMNSLNFNNSNDRKNMAHPYHRCRHDSYLIVIATLSETAATSHKHTGTTEEILSF